MKNFITLLLVPLLFACSSPTDRFAEFHHQSEEHMLRAGERAVSKGDYAQAIKNFEALEVQFPFGLHTQKAKLAIIHAYYQHEDLPLALEAAKRFTRLYPHSQWVDYAYYMQGVIHFETGWHWAQRRLPYQRSQHDLALFQEAFKDFHVLIDQFPHSIYRADAQKRMIYIRNTLAQNEIEIARFYLKKKAYAAAKERAVFILEKYQGAPQVQEALRISQLK